MDDIFRIEKIFEIGLAKELNFILSKNNILIYVFSNIDGSKRSELKKIMKGRLYIDIKKGYFPKKIDTIEKEIITNERKNTLSLKGEVIDINGSNIVIDCAFIFNFTMQKDKVRDIKVGDFISIEQFIVWVYNLQAIGKQY